MSTRMILLPLVALALTVGGLWQSRRTGWPFAAQPANDNVAATQHADRQTAADRVVAEGRLVCYPGAEVTVGAELGGAILHLRVEERMLLRKGDLIAEIRSDDLRASRAEALARLAEAEADIRFYEREVWRMEQLLARNASSHTDIATNRRGLDVARARRASALASRDHYDALIAKTRIVSPIDGVVLARYVHPGETIQAAARLVTIADLKRVRVEAEVDEFDVGRVTLGASVRITAEGFRDISWQGTVEEIPDAVVMRRIQPEDPGRPTDTRVLLVKIALAEPTPLKLGQRVEVELMGSGAR
jgi:HlyD family secretion protein